MLDLDGRSDDDNDNGGGVKMGCCCGDTPGCCTNIPENCSGGSPWPPNMIWTIREAVGSGATTTTTESECSCSGFCSQQGSMTLETVDNLYSPPGCLEPWYKGIGVIGCGDVCDSAISIAVYCIGDRWEILIWLNDSDWGNTSGLGPDVVEEFFAAGSCFSEHDEIAFSVIDCCDVMRNFVIELQNKQTVC